MTTSIDAVYEQGVLRPLEPLALPEGTKVAIVVLDTDAAKLAVVREAMSDPLFLADLREVAEVFR